MGNYNRDNRSDSRPDYGRRDFGSRGSDREMFKAVCSKCGRDCDVPFKPNGSKPVFCSNCFRNNKGSSDSRSYGGGNMGGSSRYSDKPMFDAVCDKCGNNCKIPFQPREGKPVYCSNCFGDKNKGIDRAPAAQSQYPQFKEQFQALNGKLDKILRFLEPSKPMKEDPMKDAPLDVTPIEIAVEDIIVNKMEDEKPEEPVKSKEKKKKAPKKTASSKKE